jgi:uncharacterized membrane protein YgcG
MSHAITFKAFIREGCRRGDVWCIVIFILIVLAGCRQQAPVNHSEDFTSDDQPKAIDRLLDAQAARGAASDATLYDVHFDGAQLNSLGTAKLDLMVKDGGALPLAVWMAVSEDDKMQMRRLAVAAYLKDKGVALDQVRFAIGPNPATGSPAAQGLKDLDKLDSSSNDAANASASGAADPSSLSGGGGSASGGQSPSH